MTTTRPHFDVEFRVRYAETDQMGVVYHSEYLVWCEVGRTEYIRALGLPYAEMERRGALASPMPRCATTDPRGTTT
jgi:YbgC/YbaW family acyl-CoA thioester hydrolase